MKHVCHSHKKFFIERFYDYNPSLKEKKSDTILLILTYKLIDSFKSYVYCCCVVKLY